MMCGPQGTIAFVSEAVHAELQARRAPVATIISQARVSRDASALSPVEVAFLSRDIVSKPSHLEAFFDDLRNAHNLRWLHVCSAGADRPALAELLSRGVRLSTSSGANAVEVCHSAVAGLLALARGVPDWIEAQRRHEWRPLTGGLPPGDIAGQTAVVVGMGAIGTEIARVLRALHVHVVGVSRSGAPNPHFDEVIRAAELDGAFRRADWLLLACPLTTQTRGLVDSGRLHLLPPGARLINVSRGGVVVEQALLEAIRERRLSGAYLDVFETEPLPAESPFWDLPGVLISAHRAGLSTGVHRRTLDMFLDNLSRWREGTPLRNEVTSPTSGQV